MTEETFDIGNLEEMEESSRIIVLDMDEVIVNITPKWASILVERYQSGNLKMGKYLDLHPRMENLISTIPHTVILREDYPLASLFTLKEEYSHMITEVSKIANDEILEILAEDEDFYMDLPLTPLGKGIQIGLLTENITKLYILTHSHNDATDKAKKKYIEKQFKDSIDKVEVVYLRLDESKVDFLNSLEGDCALFADDSPSNLIDVIENYKYEDLQLLIPQIPYTVKGIGEYVNDIGQEEIDEIVKSKNMSIHTYNKFFTQNEIEGIDGLIPNQEEENTDNEQ